MNADWAAQPIAICAAQEHHLQILGGIRDPYLFHGRRGQMAQHHHQPVEFQIKLAAAVMTAALVQAPLRFAAYALMLRRSRRAYPQMFDGHAAAGGGGGWR
jgi:hypothetical protein